MAKKTTKSEDLDFTYILQFDPELEEWRVFAADWIKSQKRAQDTRKKAIDKFLIEYIHGLGLPKFPSNFLSIDFDAPLLANVLKNLVDCNRLNNYVLEFLDWVLENHFSAEDDNGKKVIAPGFTNPFTKKKHNKNNVESNKTALPHRYLKELRDILCPPNAKSFSDWEWAIENAFDGTNGGDWFAVDPELIDQNDPGCVWRKRTVSVRAHQDPSTESMGHQVVGEREVVEIWSPIRWVALYVKLELPLRTSQVRWLDSGEADTWRYQGGVWVENQSSLTRGSTKHPFQKGVFRRFSDPGTGEYKTALYINTNKTADIDKAEDAKGYVVPWDHPRVLPWLERLRDWQTKYNPISAPAAWASLGIVAAVGRLESDYKKTYNALNLMKNKGEITIDRRKNAPPASSAIRSEVLPAVTLSDMERKAMRQALSEDFLKDEGWTVDSSGRIKNDKGRPIFAAGFATALRKIIEHS